MDTTELIKLIEDADDDVLQEIITDWLKDHQDFREHVERRLGPEAKDINFGYELCRKVNRETKEFYQRNTYVHEATDWSAVYYDLVKPWEEQAESLPTEKLLELTKEIVTEVGMRVTEDDFNGDDWYGDDFSGSIGDIMESLGNIAGLLLVRNDVSDDMISEIEEIVIKAGKTDIIGGYIGCVPYGDIAELINIRREAEEVTCGMYDVMIKANYGYQAGKWICRQIDFLREIDMPDAAQQVMDDNLDYPTVCLKKYDELLKDDDWKAAVALLDEAQKRKDNSSMRYSLVSTNWLEMKQSLLMQYGSKEDQIENLRQLFFDSYDGKEKEKYYDKLKSMIPTESWKEFYHKLLSEVSGYSILDKIAPFLIKEGELSWLFRLVCESEKLHDTDYRTPLRYAEALSPEFHGETAAILVRTFKAYAADRFPRNKKVKSGKYSYFCADLVKLMESGYSVELNELVKFFLLEYKFRPSFVKELRAIQYNMK